MEKIVAANWKMFKTREEARKTAMKLRDLLSRSVERRVLVFPPFTALPEVAQAFAGTVNMAAGGQNVYPAQEGAFTGEISPSMLRDAGALWVLTGHSERRQIMGESLDFVGRKTTFSLGQGLHVLLCIGESLVERDGGQLERVLSEQLRSALGDLPCTVNGNNFAIAYEPVWAIGTGKVATLPEILEAHALVRSLLLDILAETGRDIAILYGGSVKPDNASAIMALDNVDGLLVGGASLQAESFARIVTA